MQSERNTTQRLKIAMETRSDHRDYLASTEVVNWHHTEVRALAKSLAGATPIATAKHCFEWVRDEIQHCMDYRRNELTCSASDVIASGTGFCYAKSHLLAALLRANEIPAGFCYQRLTVDGAGPPYSLHGLNAVWLAEFGWYRIDARGNKPGVAAEFVPPAERLAFLIQRPGEYELPGVFADPLPQVIDALQRYDNAAELAVNLPDMVEPGAA